MDPISAAVSTGIIALMNIVMALITAQQEVNAGVRQYTPEEIEQIHALNDASKGSWQEVVAAAKARLTAGGQDSPSPQ